MNDYNPDPYGQPPRRDPQPHSPYGHQPQPGHQQPPPGYQQPYSDPYTQQQPPYPGQHPGHQAARPVAEDNGTAVLVFVLGLLGIVGFAILSPIAWIVGHGEKRKLEEQGLREPGLLAAGRIMGMIVTILILVVVGLVLLVGFATFMG